jgi:hypothetical protein
MHASFNWLAVVVLGVLVMQDGAGGSQSAASWLDEPAMAGWNKPGQAVPAAPKVQELVNPSCRNQAPAPQGAEEKRVRDQGWDLVGTVQETGQVRIVRGTASYDGMCRPMQYQDFVFVRGTFAGTLAPAPMDSRTDGALGRVSLSSPTQLTAEYSRYEKSDALCCPSRITRITFDIEGDPPVVRARSAETSKTGVARRP